MPVRAPQARRTSISSKGLEGGVTRRRYTRRRDAHDTTPDNIRKDNMDSGFSERRSPAHLAPKELDGGPIVIFLTVCTKDRRSILATEQITNLVTYWWRQADAWLVGRYVVMPDHIHLFCSPRNLNPHPLKRWVQFWKAGVTRDFPLDTTRPIWQRDFWDRQIRRSESYDEKWEYVRNNPCRHGFVQRPEDWPFQGELNVLEWRG
jgi:putative transposase